MNYSEVLALATSIVISVHDDAGGLLLDYHRDVQAAIQAGTRVEISGYCYSGCTLWLAADACVHRGTVLGFHAPSGPTDEAEALGRLLMMVYYAAAHPDLLDWFLTHAAHLESNELAGLHAEQVVDMGAADFCEMEAIDGI